jgi:hypothetical protein
MNRTGRREQKRKNGERQRKQGGMQPCRETKRQNETYITGERVATARNKQGEAMQQLNREKDGVRTRRRMSQGDVEETRTRTAKETGRVKGSSDHDGVMEQHRQDGS